MSWQMTTRIRLNSDSQNTRMTATSHVADSGPDSRSSNGKTRSPALYCDDADDLER